MILKFITEVITMLMKMKITRIFVFFILIISFLPTVSRAQIILSENFEGTFPPTGWTMINAGQYFQGWGQNTFGFNSVSGNNSMVCNIGPFNADAWAFTPTLNLNTNTLYRVSYYYRGNMGGGTTGKFKLTLGNGNAIPNQNLIIHNYPAVVNTSFAEGIDTVAVSSNGNYNFSFHCYSDANENRVFIDSVVIKALIPSACSGIPSIGVATAPSDVAPLANFTLSLSGNYLLYSGINFQWQSSLIGANNFTNIPGANTQVFSTSETVNTDYRCIVTCTNSGASVISNITTVNCSNNGSLFRLKFSGTNTNRDINGIHFLTASMGFVAFANSIGYTVDSGQTYLTRNFTPANTNFNGYPVNLTFGFEATGVYAFSQDSLLAYGNYGAEPAILFSANQGVNWKVVFHQPYGLDQNIDNSIYDIKFWNSTNGVAINGKYILQTANKGQSWTIKAQLSTAIISRFAKLSLPTATRAFAIAGNKIYRTIDTGAFWSEIANTLPANTGLNFNTISFVNANVGYITKDDNLAVFKTINGGGSWVQMNDETIMPVGASDVFFVNETTGFVSQPYGYEVFKTTNSGVTWEKCKRNTSLQNANYGMRRMFFLNSQTAWAGGRVEYLMMTTTGGNPTLPKANFKIDTINYTPTGVVNLTNFSKPYYQHQWFVNGALLNTSFNTSYLHNIYLTTDTIKLVESNGVESDTLTQYRNFPIYAQQPLITSFAPGSGTISTLVSISGIGFNGTTAVSFGGIPAQSFVVNSNTSITAVVAGGSTGSIVVTTPNGTGSATGFQFTLSPPPSIFGFFPAQGVIGTPVTITGNNFNPIATNNIIFFGKIKANIISASSTQLVCNVPAGSSFDPIKVINLTNHLSGSSSKPFTVTFPGPGNILTSSFKNLLDIQTVDPLGTTISPFSAITADMDGDGKNDVLARIIQSLGGFYHYYRNTSTPGHFSFDSSIRITSGGAQFGTAQLAAVDIDGDGKLDLITRHNYDISIRRNKSTPGNFLLSAPAFANNLADNIGDISIDDLDADGRPDIVNLEYNPIKISVSRNVSFDTTIKFAAKVIFPVTFTVNQNGGGGSISKSNAIGDLDFDGKPEIVSVSDSNIICILKNTSTFENITFQPNINYSTISKVSSVYLRDIDFDGKTDILINYSTGINSFSLFKNTTIGGIMSFAPRQDFNFSGGNGYAEISAINNFSGDSLPDFATSGFGDYFFRVFKNQSIPGINAFNSGTNYSQQTNNMSSGDLDGDGKPDILVTNNNGSYPSFSFFRNRVNEPIDVPICASNNIIKCKSNLIGNSYRWQLNTGTGFFDITNNAVYSGATTDSLTINNAPPSFAGYKYHCIVDNNLSGVYVINFPNPTLTQSSNPICSGTNVFFTGSSNVINEGIQAVPNYQWTINGNIVGTNNLTYSSNTLINSDTLRLKISYSPYCIVSPNSIILAVYSNTIPTVTISVTNNNPSNCSGANLTFTATPTNGGSSPTYQWKVNGVNSGTNSATFTSNTLQNNDQVKVIITNTTSCATTNTATSNIIVVSTSGILANAGNDVIICAGGSTQLAGSGGTTFSWSPATGLNNPNIANPIATPSITTLYVLTVSNGICISNDTVLVTVNSSSITSVNISSTNTNICSNTSVTFTANSANGGSIPSYQWKVNGVNAGTNSPTFTTSSLQNNDQVKVVMNSNLTCASPANATSNIITMAVTPVPVANAGNDVSICSGSSTQLSGSGGTTYLWSPTSGLNNANISNPIASPSITTAYILIVSNGACTSRDTVVITVAQPAIASVTINTPSNNICIGSNASFTAVALNGGATPSYQWKVNGINAGTNNAIFTTGSLQNNDLITVGMTSSLTCVLPANATSNTITMVVTLVPVANAGNNVNICGGSSTQLTGSGGNTYLWSPSTGLNNANIPNPVASPASTTTYVLTVSNGSCTSTDMVVVTVAQPVTPTVTINTPNINICTGSSVTFTSTPANGGNNPSYQWKVNGINAGTNSLTFSSSTLNNGDQITCVLTSNANCVTGNNIISNVITMAVSSAIIPAVTILSSNTNICSNTLATFTANPTNAGANPTYQWKVNGINAGTNSTTFSTGSLQNNDQVTVVLTSSLACSSPANATSNTLIMSVTPAPVSNAGNDVSICAGNSTQLVGSGGATYLWSPATGLSNANIANPVATPASTTAYILTVLNGTCISRDTVLINVAQPITPTVSISTASNNICSESNTAFTAVALNAGANPIYQWQVNGINTGTNSSAFTSNNLQNNATVKVMVTISGCTNSPVVTSNVITMNVATLSHPVVNLNTNILSVTNADANAIYTWQVLTNTVWGDVIPTATGITYTIPQAGEYRVKAEKLACTSYSGSQISTRINTFDSTLLYISLNPNPTRGLITVSKIVPSQKWQSLDVINFEGRIVLPSKNISGLRSVPVSVNNLSPGLYFIRLTNDDGRKISYRFIKL